MTRWLTTFWTGSATTCVFCSPTDARCAGLTTYTLRTPGGLHVPAAAACLLAVNLPVFAGFVPSPTVWFYLPGVHCCLPPPHPAATSSFYRHLIGVPGHLIWWTLTEHLPPAYAITLVRRCVVGFVVNIRRCDGNSTGDHRRTCPYPTAPRYLPMPAPWTNRTYIPLML